MKDEKKSLKNKKPFALKRIFQPNKKIFSSNKKYISSRPARLKPVVHKRKIKKTK